MRIREFVPRFWIREALTLGLVVLGSAGLTGCANPRIEPSPPVATLQIETLSTEGIAAYARAMQELAGRRAMQ